MNNQDAIEMLKSMLPEKISYAELIGASSCYGDGGLVYADPEPYAIETAISALEQQLTNGWIPVSERLPEKREEVLLEVKLDGYYSIVIGSYCIVNGKWEIGNDVMGYDWEEDMVDEVIAWQPLPPKYKEVSE